MVKALIDIPENENRILTILKGKYGFRNKEQVIISLIKGAEQDLEPELRPEFVEEMRRIDKEKGIPFKDIAELRKLTGE